MGVLLEVTDLHTHFHMDQGVVKAVNGVSFVLSENTTLGIVGESGCGKSVMARSILRMLGPHGRIVRGSILLYGRDGVSTDVVALDPKGRELQMIRGKSVSMVFQEPMSSFSPVHTLADQIGEAIVLHQRVSKAEARGLAIEALAIVGIPRPEQRIDQYPHQMSGGMLQRAMIAMALSCRPSILIADEPTTAIDVTTQAQILDLMRRLQRELGMSIIMITHNLGVIAEMADSVIVMYMGIAVETAPVKELFAAPRHPYTQALFRSIPALGGARRERLDSIEGSVPDAYNIPQGCPFHPRCAMYQPGLCDRQVPGVTEVNDHHTVRCLLVARSVSHG